MNRVRRTARRPSVNKLGFATLSLSLVGVLAACSTGDTAGESGQAAGSADGEFTVAFSQAHLSDPFQQVLLEQLQQQAKEQGGSISGTANANDDPGKQVTDISTLLARSPSALLVAPVDAEAIVPAIETANQQGIPVISIDQAPAGGEVAMVVRADNVRMGMIACEEMGRLLNGAGTVLELQGALSSANGLQRSQGFGECMKQNFPGITIVQTPTDWQMEKATTGAQTILSTQQVDGVYWASDFFLPGIQNVLNDQGKWKKVGEPGHIAIVGVDGTPEALATIREGYQDATVSQPLDLYAKYGIQYAKEAADGKSFEEGPTDHDSEIVVTDGIPADNLPAPLVTKENVDDKALWANQV
jgi:ribose transport system substrate-binding protein